MNMCLLQKRVANAWQRWEWGLHLSQKNLVLMRPIYVGGVKERDALLHCVVNELRGFLLGLGRPVSCGSSPCSPSLELKPPAPANPASLWPPSPSLNWIARCQLIHCNCGSGKDVNNRCTQDFQRRSHCSCCSSWLLGVREWVSEWMRGLSGICSNTTVYWCQVPGVRSAESEVSVSTCHIGIGWNSWNSRSGIQEVSIMVREWYTGTIFPAVHAKAKRFPLIFCFSDFKLKLRPSCLGE